MAVRTFGEDVRTLLLQRHPPPAVRSPVIRLNVRSRSTRSSRTNRRPTGSESERFQLLESSGDAAASFAIGIVVYRHLTRAPQASPAIFAAYRSLLQSNYTFSLIALAYDLGSRLDPPSAVPFSDRDLLNDSARKTFGDAFEALVGRLEVDGLHEALERWLDGVFAILREWADE
ncbi:hypothetical protein RHOSPDRAFT_27238 [Rhodotorula sp. JG-1b]|nr:hypothetical protein RHOSPDRAFT_27238 [Rhodotorula sp. JG-1b]